MQIEIPELSLVILIGVSSSGKSTFAKKHFKPTEILASDYCRALICDDENNQDVTQEAFEILHFIAARRLAAGKLTVIDATNVQAEARRPLLNLARQYHLVPVAIIFDLPETVNYERNKQRSDRHLEDNVIQRQYIDLRTSLENSLERKHFKQITILNSVTEIETVKIKRVPLPSNLKHERGPFDIIGDVHGCFDELKELLEKLGYVITTSPGNNETITSVSAEEKNSYFDQQIYHVTHPQGRKVIFLGDLVDRGPKIPHVLRLVMDMVTDGNALCVPGNHDVKLIRKLNGHKLQLTYGLAESVQQLEPFSALFHTQIINFIYNLHNHLVLDQGQLVVAHAGMAEPLQGRRSGKVREFALYGQTTGERDSFGLPIRYNWAADYQGAAMVVYGHTPVAEALWQNNTICIDTGCVFGGKLTALRYPEKKLESIPAQRMYYVSIKPFFPHHTQSTSTEPT
jgi:protein phosphatase